MIAAAVIVFVPSAFSISSSSYYNYCCGARVASEQRVNQDLRRLCYVEVDTNCGIHHFLPECIALTIVHCATFYQ